MRDVLLRISQTDQMLFNPGTLDGFHFDCQQMMDLTLVVHREYTVFELDLFWQWSVHLNLCVVDFSNLLGYTDVFNVACLSTVETFGMLCWAFTSRMCGYASTVVTRLLSDHLQF